MRNTFQKALACVLLAACANPSVETGQNFNGAKTQELKVGESDQAAARNALGGPFRAEQRADGNTVWTYAFSKNEFSGTTLQTYSPLLAALGAREVTNQATRKNLTLVFRGDLLTFCLLTESEHVSTGQSVGLAAITPGSGSKREVACAGANPEDRPPWLFVY